ncbi:MAG: excalibur calcium-binding domain-containing protein [Caldimonas sp.]
MDGKKTILIGLALAGALSAGVAQARGRDEVQWSVTIGGPIGAALYGQQGYGQQAYGQPVYAQPVYGAPAPIYRGEHRYQRPTRWDRDGDGIPNRYDRVYNPRRDRDGDGIPNRYDRRDDRGSRR